MAITTVHNELIAVNAISGTAIADNAVTSVHIAKNNIGTVQIAQNSVTSVSIALNQVTGTQIANNAITSTQLADNAVTATKIPDGTQLALGATTFSGNVGIGVDPTTLLHINGSGDAIRVESTNTGSGGAQVDLLQFTTSPADNDIHALINMGGYTSGTSSAYGSSIRSVWSDVSAKEAQLEFFTRDDSDFAARMIIDKDGNVGIGDTPSAPLHVTRTASGYPILRLTQNGADQYNTIYLQNSNSTAATVVMGTGGGSVGNSSWANSAVFGTTSDAKVVLLQNDSAAVTIDTNQKVGIGTASPAQFLSVHGNVNFNTTNNDANESRHLFVMGGSADPGTYSIYDAAENVKVKFNAGGDSYIAGGSFHVGSTDSISSSAEVFSVYNASTGHSKMVNNSDSYGTLYMHNESTTADTFQPFIIMQKGGGNRGNIGLRHTDSVIGISGQNGISLRTGSTSVQASSERLEIGSDGFIKFGKGCGFGSLHNTGQNITTSFSNYFDFSTLSAGSGENKGMYLVALSRNGGSVGTRLLAFVGVSTNSTVFVYEILASGVLSIQGNGSSLQVKHSSSGTQSIQGTAIPVAIDHN